MATNPKTINSEESVAHAEKLMTEHNIRHLPVIEKGKITGIVSDRDIREFSPNKATTLERHELNHLLATT
jgi:acetoin utilization protein AcuB